MNTRVILKALACVLMPATFGAFITLGSASEAHAGADNCKNVDIKVKNDRPVQIKVTRIQYYDYDVGKWREEAVTNRRIDHTKSYKWTRDLEHVNNDETKIRVTYRDHLGGSRWGKERTEVGAKHVCKNGEFNKIVVD